MQKHILGILCSVTLLTACGSTESRVVQSVQKQDKQLSCTDIMLEINEAEYWHDKANKNRGLSLRNVLHPLGYGSTYMSAADAMDAAETRVDYLKRVYDIRHCADDALDQKIAVAPAMPSPTYAPLAYTPAYAPPAAAPVATPVPAPVAQSGPVNYYYPPEMAYATPAPYREF